MPQAGENASLTPRSGDRTLAGQKRVSIGGQQAAKEYFGDYGNESGKHGGGQRDDGTRTDSGHQELRQEDVANRSGLESQLGRPARQGNLASAARHRLIRDNPRLRQLLLQEQSFEEAFAATALEPFTEEDRHAFQQALLDIFYAKHQVLAKRE
jgi:hypothetical protein